MKKDWQECLLLPRDNALLPWNQARPAKSLLPAQLGKLASSGIDDHGLIPAKCFFSPCQAILATNKNQLLHTNQRWRYFPSFWKASPSRLKNSADERVIWSCLKRKLHVCYSILWARGRSLQLSASAWDLGALIRGWRSRAGHAIFTVQSTKHSKRRLFFLWCISTSLDGEPSCLLYN